MTEMEDCRKSLMESFPGSIFNCHDEFIADRKSNTYFIFGNCENPIDVECKLFEWLSRAAYKSEPYRADYKNRQFHEKILNGINYYLGTNFSEDDMEVIYTHLGNACNHKRTLEFFKSGYDMKVLEGADNEK